MAKVDNIVVNIGVELENKREINSMEREVVVQKIIQLIIDELDKEGQGRLTSAYAISVLKETIGHIESVAIMRPVRCALASNSSEIATMLGRAFEANHGKD